MADRVVSQTRTEAEETTKSGIVLPGAAKEKPQVAEVVAVGPGGIVDGKEVDMTVKVGDKVIIFEVCRYRSKVATAKNTISFARATSSLSLSNHMYK